MPKDDIDQLIATLLDAGRRIRAGQQGDDRLSPYTALRVEALRFIADHAEPTMRDLAASFCVTPPSATALVNGLVKSGAVVRRPDRADRRVTRLALTAAGRKALAAGTVRMHRNLRAVLGRLSPAERKSLDRMFAKLASTYSTS